LPTLIISVLVGVTRKFLGIPFAGESLAQTVIAADAAIEGLDTDVSVEILRSLRNHEHYFLFPSRRRSGTVMESLLSAS
jgi:hypothetical protein